MSHKNIITSELFCEVLKSSIYKSIMDIVNSNRLIKDRLKALDSLGLETINKAVGSGGVGSLIFRKDGVYVQVSYGVTRYNYAELVKIGFIYTNKENPISKPYFISE